MMDDDSKLRSPLAPAFPDEPSGGPDVKVVDRRWWARQDGQLDASDEELRKPTYLEELERQLAEKDQLLQRYMTEHRQAVGEFEEVKGRIRRELVKDVERSRRVVLTELLDVLDNLERAMSAAQASQNFGALLEGLDLVERQFLSKLQAFGVARLDALGDAFDPSRHEAVATVPVTDADQDGRVTGVIRPGYSIGDEVLRPAMVAVGRLEDAR